MHTLGFLEVLDMRILFTTMLIGLALSNAGAEILLIDDFSQPGRSALGTQWQGFTDRVMGGRSTIEAGYVERGDDVVLAMRGNVSLENNGGFVQVRLPLSRGTAFDASAFSGIAVEVRGAAGSYFVHLRTQRTRRPWQYFKAPVEISSEWSRVEIPFSSFEGEDVRGDLDTDGLFSLALVAGTREFFAEMEVRRVEFYQ
jgi:hypothetical protein